MVLEYLESKLASVGLTRDDIIKIRFTTQDSTGQVVAQAVEDVYARFFRNVEPKPVRRYCIPPGCQIELLTPRMRSWKNTAKLTGPKSAILMAVDAVARNRYYEHSERC